MKTAFEVVAEEERAPRYNVRTHRRWSSGKIKWFDDIDEAHAYAIRNSKRLIGRKPDQYQYDYQVTEFGSDKPVTHAIYRNGESEPQENYDRYGKHKSEPGYDPNR